MATASKGIPFFVPAANNPQGTVISDDKSTPKLFTPLKINGLTIPNRIGLSPMAMYSAASSGDEAGFPNDYHFLHYSSLSLRGVGLMIAEATAVCPEGRGSPNDCGIWTDGHAVAWKRIVDFVHSQGGKIGIQLGHAGRKGSTWPLHVQGKKLTVVNEEEGGWPSKVLSPSAISFSEEYGYPTPAEITTEKIAEVIQKFKEAADRALNIAGFDFVEIHGAYGYLISSFLSGTANKRTDDYGGTLDKRMKFLLDIVDAVKSDEHPLAVRISAEEWSDEEGAWTLDDSIKLSDKLIEHGVDLLDVSAGGININAKRRDAFPGYQAPLAKAIKDHVGDKLVIASVGCINSSKVASDIVEDGSADIALVGTQFLRQPSLPWDWADELGVKVQVARAIGWPHGIV